MYYLLADRVSGFEVRAVASVMLRLTSNLEVEIA